VLDVAAQRRPITFERVEQMYVLNSHSSDLSNIRMGYGGPGQLASKKKTSRSGFILEAEDASIEGVDAEGDADIRAKRSQVRDIKARKSTEPQRLRAIGGVAAIVLGAVVVALGRESASTTMNVEGIGTKWSLVTTVPGLVLAFIGAIALVVPSRKV